MQTTESSRPLSRRLVDACLEVFEGFFQTFPQLDLRFPAEQLFRASNVGTAAGGVVLRERLEDDLCTRAGEGKNLVGTLEDGPFLGIADVDGEMFVRTGE